MLYVALGLVAVNVVEWIVWAGVVRSLIRQHARERDLLVNQMCNLADRPWQPAPSQLSFHEAPERDVSLVVPDQWPDGDL